MKIRRVTTGHNVAGKAVFVSDTEVEGDAIALLGGAIHGLWGADHLPEFPDAGKEPAHTDYFPPLGGFRFITFTLAAEGASAPTQGDPQAMMNEFMAKMAGAATWSPTVPGCTRAAQ